jgi:hypothetical protein
LDRLSWHFANLAVAHFRQVVKNLSSSVTHQRQKARGLNVSRCGFAADEMLGYIVSMYAQTMGHFVGVFVTVQSARHPAYVQSRITAFLREKQANALQVYFPSACWYMHVVMNRQRGKGTASHL